MSEAARSVPLRHLDRRPGTKARLGGEVLARPITVNIHLGFRQKQSFPSYRWACVRTSSLPRRISQKLNCGLEESWPRPPWTPVPSSILIRVRVLTAGLSLVGSAPGAGCPNQSLLPREMGLARPKGHFIV